MKTISQRIEYFSQKVAQFGAIHPASVKPKWYAGRVDRLMAYKTKMDELINESTHREVRDAMNR